MLNTFVAVLLVLHGMVHLLYSGQSSRLFELEEGMVWPDGSWALSTVFGNSTARTIASVMMLLAAVGFALAGAAVLLSRGWWRGLTVGAAVLSSVSYLLLWDGKLANLDGQGAIGILINLAALVIVVYTEAASSGF